MAALVGGQRVYGVNTGMGYLANTTLQGAELKGTSGTCSLAAP